MVPARNGRLFPQPTASSIPILLLVHKRTLYLEPSLRLYQHVRGESRRAMLAAAKLCVPVPARLVGRTRLCGACEREAECVMWRQS